MLLLPFEGPKDACEVMLEVLLTACPGLEEDPGDDKDVDRDPAVVDDDAVTDEFVAVCGPWNMDAVLVVSVFAVAGVI